MLSYSDVFLLECLKDINFKHALVSTLESLQKMHLISIHQEPMNLSGCLCTTVKMLNLNLTLNKF